jgi:hypothetical protein
MSRIIFIVGSSASGKSTTERNLRLRIDGQFKPGKFQEVDEHDLIFVGKVLFADESHVLRLSGGDTIPFDVLFEATEMYPDSTLIFEKVHIPEYVIDQLHRESHTMHFCQLHVAAEVAKQRLIRLRHPSALKENFHAYRPLKDEYLLKRDTCLREHGVRIDYIGGTLIERCRILESIIGVQASFDYVLYNFVDSVDTIYQRFYDGGDPAKSSDEW